MYVLRATSRNTLEGGGKGVVFKMWVSLHAHLVVWTLPSSHRPCSRPAFGSGGLSGLSSSVTASLSSADPRTDHGTACSLCSFLTNVPCHRGRTVGKFGPTTEQRAGPTAYFPSARGTMAAPVFSSEKDVTELHRRLSISLIPFQGLTTETLTTRFSLLWDCRHRTPRLKVVCSGSCTD